jgi:hypothetical protein
VNASLYTVTVKLGAVKHPSLFLSAELSSSLNRQRTMTKAKAPSERTVIVGDPDVNVIVVALCAKEGDSPVAECTIPLRRRKN